MTKVLMVCLGNICRSPLAEGILQGKVDAKKVFVDSAGTAGYHVGALPDPRSIAVAAKHGLDITHQRSRKLKARDLKDFDHIYVMDQSNYRDTIALAQNEKERQKVQLLCSISDLGATEVPDPYYDGDDGFKQVFQLIDRACGFISEKLKGHGS